jgi:hypothetical protein
LDSVVRLVHLGEWVDLSLTFVRHWVPPSNWSRREWEAESRVWANAAAVQAVADFDPRRGVEMSLFVRGRVSAGLLTAYRRKLAFARHCTAGAKGEVLICGRQAADCEDQTAAVAAVGDVLAELSDADCALLEQLYWAGRCECEVAREAGVSQQAISLRKPVLGRGFLKLSDFTALLDQNPGVGSVELSNYGEPFLHPDLPGILRAAYERRVMLTLRNGANLNNAREDALEALVRCWRACTASRRRSRHSRRPSGCGPTMRRPFPICRSPCCKPGASVMRRRPEGRQWPPGPTTLGATPPCRRRCGGRGGSASHRSSEEGDGARPGLPGGP